MSERHVQYVAVFLIVFAAFCIGVGSHFQWRDLINYAQTFGGGGVGILTGQKLASIVNKDGGSTNIDANSAPTK